MPLFENARGTRIQFRLPHATGWKELDAAKAKHDTLIARERSLYLDRTRCENERATLATADRQALAQAQYDDPTAQIDANPRIAEVEKEIAELTRQIEAISEAIDKAEQAVIEVVYEHREAWMEDVDPKVDDAYAAYTDALAALVSARADAAEKTSLFFWLRNFDDVEPKGMLYSPITDPYVPLDRINGERFRFSEVITALREDGVRPIPQDEQSFIPWGISPFKNV